MRFWLFLIGAFFGISAVVNALELDWPDTLFAGSLALVSMALFAVLELRERKATARWQAELASLEGLGHCPISSSELRELFQWLDRPNPPACTHQFPESTQYLTEQSLPVDETIRWLQANGAYCDCEVIYNTADKFGDVVGFEPTEDLD